MRFILLFSRGLATFLLCATAFSAQAATFSFAIQNDTPYHFILNGKTTADAICQDDCYATLNPKAQQWIQVNTPTGWMNIQYDICTDVTYSEEREPLCQQYLGHFGVNFASTGVGISNAQAGDITLNYNNKIGHISFSPNNPPPPVEVPAPIDYFEAPFRGVNIAAAEFNSDSGNIDWIIQEGFPNKTDLTYFSKMGMNTYRIPIRWSYAQPQLKGALNDLYVNKLYESTKMYLEAGHSVILDLHSYMHFEADPRKDPLHSQYIVSREELVDFWDKISTKLKPLSIQYASNGKNQLIFDLMNEPEDDISSQDILNRYNAVIAMLRQKGILNLVLLEGAHYSGMHSWFNAKDSQNKSNADIFAPSNIVDPAKNYAINVHQYFDSNFSGTQLQCTGYPLSEIKKFMDWSRDTKQKFMVTEFGGADAGNCQPIIADFLNTLQSIAVNVDSKEGGFLGWTVWAGGRHWGGYLLSVYLNGGAQGLPNALVQHGFLKPGGDE